MQSGRLVAIAVAGYALRHIDLQVVRLRTDKSNCANLVPEWRINIAEEALGFDGRLNAAAAPIAGHIL